MFTEDKAAEENGWMELGAHPRADLRLTNECRSWPMQIAGWLLLGVVAASLFVTHTIGGSIGLPRTVPAPRIGARSTFQAQRWRSGWRLTGGGITARLGSNAIELDAGGSVTFGELSVGRGDAVDRVRLSAPQARANRVTYAASGVRQWFVAGPHGIEQGFDLVRRPAAAGGSLQLSWALGGSLRAVRSGAGINFVARSGRIAVRYGALEARDASGTRLSAWFDLHAGRLTVRVDDRGARYPVRIDPFVEQDSPLTATDANNPASLGLVDALSADGNTALISGSFDNHGHGTAFVFTRSGSSWTEQARLDPNVIGGFTTPEVATGLAMSADGNTVLLGAPLDDYYDGSVFVFTRSGSTWTQQSSLTTPADASEFGQSISLSPDGTTALIGAGGEDPSNNGAAWIFTLSGSAWSQAAELTPNDATGDPEVHGSLGAEFGDAVALSADGSTALVGGELDDQQAGSAWVFTRSGSTWTQQGPKLTSTPRPRRGRFGMAVALSGDGSTALITGQVGSWVFTRTSSSWDQQGPALGGASASAALSPDGDTAVIGATSASVYTRSGSTWTQRGAPLTADNGTYTGVAFSADESTILVGLPQFNSARVFVEPVDSVSGVVNDVARGAAWDGSEGAGASADDAATVSGAVGTTPSGTLTYSMFGGGSCSGTAISSEQVTLGADGSVPPSSSTAPLALGSYAYRASYAGDDNYLPTKGACQPFSVGMATPQVESVVKDASSGNAWSGSEVIGASAKDSASVAGASGFVPSGTVSYSLFASGSCAGSAVSSDEVTLGGDGGVPDSSSTGALGSGSYSFQASYSGDANYLPSTSSCEPFTVKMRSATSVACSPNPVFVGAPSSCKATVWPKPDGGTASFTRSGMVIPGCGAVPVAPATGTASCTTSYAAAGAYPIKAAYAGDRLHDASVSSSVTQVVAVAPPGQTRTVVGLTASRMRPVTGERVRFTASVSPVPDGGKLDFLADGKVIARCAVGPVNPVSGKAVCKTTFASAGVHVIQAAYVGTARSASALSASLRERVTWSVALRGRSRSTPNGVIFTLACVPRSGGCPITATLSATQLTYRNRTPGAHTSATSTAQVASVGTLTIRIAAGAAKTITIKLNRTGRRLLARSGRLRLVLRIILTSAGQHSTIATRTLTLTEPAPEPAPKTHDPGDTGLDAALRRRP